MRSCSRAGGGSKASSHYERIPAQCGALLEKHTERPQVRDARAQAEGAKNELQFKSSSSRDGD